MKRTIAVAYALAMATLLSACNKASEAPTQAETSTADAGGMADMPMAGETKHGKGAGIVTEIDAPNGMVTLDHGDIAELQWPAMKMAFRIKPQLLEGIGVGDKVSFEIDWNGKTGAVTKIEKTP